MASSDLLREDPLTIDYLYDVAVLMEEDTDRCLFDSSELDRWIDEALYFYELWEADQELIKKLRLMLDTYITYLDEAEEEVHVQTR